MLNGVRVRSRIRSGGDATPSITNVSRSKHGSSARASYMARMAGKKSSRKSNLRVLSISSTKITTRAWISASTTSRRKSVKRWAGLSARAPATSQPGRPPAAGCA